MRHRHRRLGAPARIALTLALASSGAGAFVSCAALASAAAAGSVQIAIPGSAARLLGQRIMVGVDGTTADAALLASIRRGRVGAVILFAHNIVSHRQLVTLTGTLQRAARAGGNPPLLISVDQEGGEVKRLQNGPPDLSPPQIVGVGGPALAGREGRATGSYLKRLGINMDLAPVVDVPTFADAFIWREGRAFSFNASTVATYSTAFALGLQARGVAATAKHFPGVGTAAIDTDRQLDELHPSSRHLHEALLPYEMLIPRGLDAIMLSTAGFQAYDATGTPTALSRRIIQDLLRKRLGFKGVTITDSPLGPPTTGDEILAGVRAARAGADILLYTDSAPGELAGLEAAMRSGRFSRADAAAAYSRIVALKRRVAG